MANLNNGPLPTTLKKGSVRKALKKAGNTPEDVKAVLDEMSSGDYDHLLAVAQEVIEDNDSDLGED